MDSEGLYTIRTDGFMNGYTQHLQENGCYDTLGKISHEQAVERLHAKGYETVRYLPMEEAQKVALARREQHRPAKPEPKGITGFELFCRIWEYLHQQEREQLAREFEQEVERLNGIDA